MEASKKRRAVLGVILPCLLGWALEILLAILTTFLFDFLNHNQRFWPLWIPFGIAWLTIVPISGIAMGILNVYCCPPDRFNESEYWNFMNYCMWIFWGLQSVTVIFGCFPCCVLIGIPILVSGWGFTTGQTIGKRWVQERTVEKFLGRRNDWEKDA